jgi:hypothetical protein
MPSWTAGVERLLQAGADPLNSARLFAGGTIVFGNGRVASSSFHPLEGRDRRLALWIRLQYSLPPGPLPRRLGDGAIASMACSVQGSSAQQTPTARVSAVAGGRR